MTGTELERLEREREFHNTRFRDNNRVTQDKFYFAVSDCDVRMQAEIQAAASGADVLEYGCGPGSVSMPAARIANSLTGIDISDVAIEHARQTASAEAVGNARFIAMNAEVLEFPDQSFDLVFGSGILHHLHLERAYAEISRVMRPGAKAIFKEPLGHNLALNLYRKLTPDARTEDEHPLVREDLELARRYFRKAEFEFFGLSSLISIPFREMRVGKPIYDVTAATDRVLTRIPPLGLQAWHVLMLLEK